MKPIQELENMFFQDLKKYNSTNFKTLLRSDLTKSDPVVHKAFSSVVTRYFIFREKHALELSESEFNMLFFKLKIDLIGKYFSEYPDADTSSLVAFQQELQAFNKRFGENSEEVNHE